MTLLVDPEAIDAIDAPPPVGEPIALPPPSGAHDEITTRWYRLVAFALCQLSATLAWDRVFAVGRGVGACLVAALLATAVTVGAVRSRHRWSLPLVHVALLVVFASMVAVPLTGWSWPAPSAIRSVLSWLPSMWSTTLDRGLPVDAEGPPLLLALVVTWIATAVGSEATLRTRARAAVLALPVLTFCLALLLGSPLPTRPLLLVAPVAVTGLAFLAVSGRDLRPGLQRRPASSPTGSDPTSRVVAIRRHVLGRGFVALAVIVALVTVGGSSLWGDPASQPSLHRLPAFDPQSQRSPLAMLPTQQSLDPSVRLFTISDVSGDLGDRIALAALDSYDGDTWESRSRFRPVGQYSPGDPRSGATETAGATITIDGLTGPWLPHPGRVARLGLRSVQSDGPSGNFVVDAGVHDGVTYRVEATNVTDVDAALSTPAVEVPGTESVQLPPNRVVAANPGTLNTGSSSPSVERCSVGSIVETARQWSPDVAGADEPSAEFARVSAIADQLRSLGGLDDERRPGHAIADVCSIIELGGAPAPGRAEQYVATMAMMVRAIGIPARVVVGYHLPPRSAAGDIVVTTADATAWVEAFIGGAGWVTFDPTPSTAKPASGAKNSPRPSRPTPASVPPTTSPITAPTTTAAPATADPGDDDATTNPSGGGRVGLIVGLSSAGVVALVIGGIVLIGNLKTRRRTRRRSAERTNDAVLGAWSEALDLLRDRGFVVRPHLTATELARAAANETEIDGVGRLLVRLARMGSAAVYSRRTLDPEARDTAWSMVDDLEHRLDAGVGIGRRFRTRCALASIRTKGW